MIFGQFARKGKGGVRGLGFLLVLCLAGGRWAGGYCFEAFFNLGCHVANTPIKMMVHTLENSYGEVNRGKKGLRDRIGPCVVP